MTDNVNDKEIHDSNFWSKKLFNYIIDASQLKVFYRDFMRQGDNRNLEQMKDMVPYVLQFDMELEAESRTPKEYVNHINYSLVKTISH